jgi:hypothetical protein
MTETKESLLDLLLFKNLYDDFEELVKEPAKNTAKYRKRLAKLKEDTRKAARVFWLYHHDFDPRYLHVNRKLVEDIIEHFNWDLDEFPGLQ